MQFEQLILDDKQQLVFEKFEHTKDNIFIQGSAGSGKSTFINYLKAVSRKSILVASPTAIAALNVGGVTLHSLFRLPVSDFIEISEIHKTNRAVLKRIIKHTDAIIIDEISMVRPDMLDAIDEILRTIKRSKKPFGGLQMLFMGDLCQLPPVITSNVYDIFLDKYGIKTPYFFDSEAYIRGDFQCFEFNHIYRQEDGVLLDNLNKLRDADNEDLYNTIKYFNDLVVTSKQRWEEAVLITPYKKIAESINIQRLEALTTKEMTYKGTCVGSFEKMSDLPSPKALRLREGALVIFNKNNTDIWSNGTQGIVEKLDKNHINVRLLNSGDIVTVTRETWVAKKYNYNTITEKVEEEEIGSYIQFPLQLGYAMTIHKAQGKTLDKVVVDMDKGAFAHGQLYVALSRTRKKEDMQLITPIARRDAIIDTRISNFLERI